MGWRKTGLFRNPEEILVLTCDVCERDIGTAHEHRDYGSFDVTDAHTTPDLPFR